MSEHNEFAPAEEQAQPEQLRQLPYSAGEMARLNFESFRFSQGDPTRLQPDILKYLLLHYGDLIDQAAVEESFEVTAAYAEKFTSNEVGHKPQSENQFKKGMKDLVEAWEEANAARGELDEGEILADLLLNDLLKDESYLVSYDWGTGAVAEGHGRDRSEPKDGTARPASKFLSHLAYYALAGHSTGYDEYNAMFSDIAETLERVATGEETQGKFGDPDYRDMFLVRVKNVVAVHLHHYPEETEAIPAHWRSDGLQSLQF